MKVRSTLMDCRVRLEELPVPAGNYTIITASSRRSSAGWRYDLDFSKTSLRCLDVNNKTTNRKPWLQGVEGYSLSLDGRDDPQGRNFHIVDASAKDVKS